MVLTSPRITRFVKMRKQTAPGFVRSSKALYCVTEKAFVKIRLSSRLKYGRGLFQNGQYKYMMSDPGEGSFIDEFIIKLFIIPPVFLS